MSRRTFVRLLPLAFTVSGALSCASAPPPPPPPPPTVAAPVKPRLHMSAELGEIDVPATKKTFDRIRPALMSCYTSGLGRVEYLAGDVKFYIRVKEDGHLHWGFLEQSTVGDRATEVCMIGVLAATQWPIPEGGEAEVHEGMGFDAPDGVRPPTAWSADRVAPALAKKSKDISACKQHGGAFQITAYVAPEKGAGHAVAAGATPPSAAADPDVDCLVGVVQAMKLPSPGSYPAKVSFSL